MIIFLTSSPSGPLNVPNDNHLLDEQNKFVEHLKMYCANNCKGLIIAAFPNNYNQNDEMLKFFQDAFNHADLSICLEIFDERKKQLDLNKYNFIMLAGGHVPTQNAYFHKIQLKEHLKNFDGVIMTVSAGTMNSAANVYAQPELEGESASTFNRHLEGLGLTNLNILPHYQMVKDYYLDGKRLFEEITYPDSYKNKFVCLLDGSYVLIKDQQTLLFGEAYLIENGKICILNTKNNIIDLSNF